MKNWKRRALALLIALTFLLPLAVPASAEGFAFNWDSDDNAGPHCKSLILLNLDTDSVVYALNPDEELPMASMTKIMTYIVAYETIPDMENARITVPQSVKDDLDGTGSSMADVMVGEEFTGLQLLYLMMVPSGNDAALTLAKYVDSLYESGQLVPEETAAPAEEEDLSSQAEGSQAAESAGSESGVSSSSIPADTDPEADGADGADGTDGTDGEDGGQAEFDGTDYTGQSYFVELMNKKAAELGCTHTHFTNPHGLYSPNHYTTAREMAVITKYAMTLPNFTEITGTLAYDQAATNMQEERTVYTTNYMLSNYVSEGGMTYYYQSATGIKTGSLQEAGHCLTASATAYGYTYIAVAMGDMEGYENGIHYEMLDVRSLFRWAVDSLEKKTLAVQGDVISSVGLKYAWNKDVLQLVAGENVAVMLPDSVDQSSILVTPDVPESVEAPIRKGEQIGTASLSYAGEVVATVPLVAAESVERSEAIHVWEQGKSVLTSPWFLVIMAVIAALLIVYIILILLYRRKQRQLRKVRRFRDM